ncbi:nucleotidyltransferase domain-containing protein [Paenibacillus lautus]|uniref:nucleotidyltransferase domain-containing protein n=1 Tax=Paenibacillus lautus TaxID=1401 RepID=UPI003D275042
MRTDYDHWEPISVSDTVRIFADIPARWYIAGGWALDLYLGEQTREHGDIDILILREEQAAIYAAIAKEWTLYKADQGTLSIWEESEYLHSVGDVWVSRNDEAPFSFQIMLVETEQDRWVYRREPSIRRPLQDISLKTDQGIPYLKPEIQLLYKGGSKNIREKDEQDLIKVLPFLHPQAKTWLTHALRTQFPSGHPWIDYIATSL